MKIKAKKNDPLFSLPDKTCITDRKFQFKLRQAISSMKLDPKSFSSHSFYRAGTTNAFKSNVSSELIQLHVDWKSDAYKKYPSFTFEDKLQVAYRKKTTHFVRIRHRVFRRTWTDTEELLKEKSFFILSFVFLSEFIIRQVQTNIY